MSDVGACEGETVGMRVGAFNGISEEGRAVGVAGASETDGALVGVELGVLVENKMFLSMYSRCTSVVTIPLSSQPTTRRLGCSPSTT